MDMFCMGSDGDIFNREGTLIATVVQEGMARLRPEF